MDPDLSWSDIVDRGYVIAGSADTVAERLEEVVRRLNVGHLMVLLQFGSMRRETVLQNSERFAADVIPKLRDTFGEWEDRWWPATTLPELADPAPIR
jgi:alkanesulfonate monooxygenase SsuD/methylene tetrahydromethanopterin reductase-like flavin-dependent oxidoreductase (luciferase family)